MLFSLVITCRLVGNCRIQIVAVKELVLVLQIQLPKY